MRQLNILYKSSITLFISFINYGRVAYLFSEVGSNFTWPGLFSGRARAYEVGTTATE